MSQSEMEVPTSRTWPAALVPADDNQDRTVFVFRADATALVGRSETADMCLGACFELKYARMMLSRTHAQVTWTKTRPGSLEVVDAHSACGTFVNDDDMPITAPTVLPAGACVTFGRACHVVDKTDRKFKRVIAALKYYFVTNYVENGATVVELEPESMLPLVLSRNGPLPVSPDYDVHEDPSLCALPLPPDTKDWVPYRGWKSDDVGAPPAKRCKIDAGADTDDFQEVIDAHTCVVCTDVFVAPVALPCQHTLCRTCAVSWLALSASCPTCKARVSSRPQPALIARATLPMVYARMDPAELRELVNRENESRRAARVIEVAAIERLNKSLEDAREATAANLANAPDFASVFEPWCTELASRLRGRLAIMHGAARKRYFELMLLTPESLSRCCKEQRIRDLRCAAANLNVTGYDKMDVSELFGALDMMLWACG